MLSNSNDSLHLPRLFFDLCCQEECTDCYVISMELLEGVEDIEPMHVDDGCVDTQLGTVVVVITIHGWKEERNNQ